MLARTRVTVVRAACRRSASSSAAAAGARRTVTLIRGDGIGPETVNAAVQALTAVGAPIDWESHEFKHVDAYELPNGETSIICPELRESMERNRFVLKGPLVTPESQDLLSPDVVLAREFKLMAHVVPVRKLNGLKTRHDKVDLVVVRENTEAEYSGLEHVVTPGVVQSIRVVSRSASRRVAKYAFEYARSHGRKRVTAVHKANIMKKADGLFLESCREVASQYRDIEFDDIIIDNCSMQLVSAPEQFDVLVTPNLYGNLLSEAAAGLVGGAGIVPGFNVGPAVRVYEQGPRHAGLDIAGKDVANPAACLLAASIMLQDMGLDEYATRLETAVKSTLVEGDPDVLTADIGGRGTTSIFTQAVINNIPPPEPKL